MIYLGTSRTDTTRLFKRFYKRIFFYFLHKYKITLVRPHNRIAVFFYVIFPYRNLIPRSPTHVWPSSARDVLLFRPILRTRTSSTYRNGFFFIFWLFPRVLSMFYQNAYDRYPLDFSWRLKKNFNFSPSSNTPPNLSSLMSACYVIGTSWGRPYIMPFRLKPACLLIYARSSFCRPSGHPELMRFRRKG